MPNMKRKTTGITMANSTSATPRLRPRLRGERLPASMVGSPCGATPTGKERPAIRVAPGVSLPPGRLEFGTGGPSDPLRDQTKYVFDELSDEKSPYCKHRSGSRERRKILQETCPFESCPESRRRKCTHCRRISDSRERGRLQFSRELPLEIRFLASRLAECRIDTI